MDDELLVVRETQEQLPETAMTTTLTNETSPDSSTAASADVALPPQLNAEEVSRYLREGLPLKELTGLGDQVWEAMYDFGYQSFQSGQFAMAEYWWSHACLFDSGQDRNWISLGVAYQRQQKYEPAIIAFSLAVKNGSTNPWAPLHGAECHLQQKSTLRAAAALDCAEEWAANSGQEQAILKRITVLRRAVERRRKSSAPVSTDSTATRTVN